jgi:hypothetical protein
MPDYSIFGGCLRSEIAFPELRESLGIPANWIFSLAAHERSIDAAELLGELDVTPACRVRMFKYSAGYRLRYDDTGTYDVSSDGRRVMWARGPQAGAGAVRADVTGRVLATALHAAGVLCLHGSAVALPGGTVAFLAPKYHGKSTLALALARAGGRLVTDDVLPVELGVVPRAIPGVHQVKLWDDTAALFGLARDAAEPGEKHLVHEFPDDRLMLTPSPLAAVYLLAPVTVENEPDDAATRVRLGDVPSAMALVRHATLGALLGGSEAAVLFERAATLARAVPVYRLDTAAGLHRVPRVVEQLLAWHTGADTPAAVPVPVT